MYTYIYTYTHTSLKAFVTLFVDAYSHTFDPFIKYASNVCEYAYVHQMYVSMLLFI